MMAEATELLTPPVDQQLSTPTEPQFDSRDNKPTQADVTDAFIQPVRRPEEILAEELTPRAKRPEIIDEVPWSLAGQIAEEDWALQNLARWLGREKHLPDPDFVMTPEMFEAAAKQDGISFTNLDELSSSHSQADWDEKVAHIKQEQDFNNEIAKYGWKGAGLRMGVSFMDPGVWGLAIATGGLGLYGKAAQVGRMATVARWGGVSAAEAGLIEAAMLTDKVTWGWEDSAASVGASLIVGGSLGALFAKPVQNLTKNIEAQAVKRQAEESGVTLSEASRTKLDGERELVNFDPLSPDSNIAPAAMTHINIKNPFGPSVRIPLRFDMMAFVKTSPSEPLRRYFGGIAQDVVGDTTTGRIVNMSATELGTQMYRTYSASFMQPYTANFNKFKEEISYGLLDRDAVRMQFSELVEQAVRRDGDGWIDSLDNLSDVQKQAVKAQRNEYRSMMRQVLKDLKEAGVDGAEAIAENALYVPRRIRASTLTRWRDQLGDDGLVDFIAQAYRSGSKRPITMAQAQSVARIHIKNIERYDGGFERVSGSVTKQQLDEIKKLLSEGGATPQTTRDIEIIEKILSDKKGGSNLSRRLDLDETFEAKGYKMEDLYESSALDGMDKYLRVMTGRVQAAKVLGIRSDAEFQERIKEIGESVIGKDPKTEARVKADIKRVDVLYRHLTGKPMDKDAGKSASGDTAFRLLMDYNYMRVMNQVGFPQFAELGNTLAFAGFRATLRSVPALKKLRRDLETGEIVNQDILRDLEAMNAIGSDYIRYQTVSSRFTGPSDEVIGHNMTDSQRKVMDLATKGKRVTSILSGMVPITVGLQRMSASAFIQKMGSLQRKALTEKDYRRFREIGWTDEVTNGIRDQLKKATYTKTGAIDDLNMTQWDGKLREEFANGIARWTYRVIQENDPGALGYFMTQRVGKAVTQFRTFMLVAHAKQFLHGVQRLKQGDLQVANAFMLSTFIGGLAYMGQSELKTIGASNRDELLHDPDKGYLAPENIAKSAFQRSAYSSLIPTGVDTLSYMFGSDPVFAYGRSSGLPSHAIFGNPSLDAFNKAIALPGNILSGDFSEAAKALPYQNMLGVTNFLRAIDEDD